MGLYHRQLQRFCHQDQLPSAMHPELGVSVLSRSYMFMTALVPRFTQHRSGIVNDKALGATRRSSGYGANMASSAPVNRGTAVTTQGSVAGHQLLSLLFM